MKVSKVVIGGQTKIDISGDTVKAENLLLGYTAHGSDGELVEGACSYDADTSSDTATAGDVLTGKTAHAKGARIDGSMPNVGAQTGAISTKEEAIAISRGYHNGEGSVSISFNERQKLIPGNIKKNIEILGVTGDFDPTPTLQEKTVHPSSSDQDITPDTGYTALSKVVVEGMVQEEITVKSTDTTQEITPTSGKDGISKVTVNPITKQTKTVHPTTSSQDVMPDNGYDGLSKVVVEGMDREEITVKSTETAQEILPTSGKDGISKVTVNPIIKQTKTIHPSTNLQEITPDSGYDGLSKVSVEAMVREEITVKSTGSSQEITPSSGKDGISKVTVSPTVTQTKSATPTTSSQDIEPDNGYDGLSKVTVNAIPNNFIDTSDATATANDILTGETAYVNGNKITGQCSYNSDTSQDTAIASDVASGKTFHLSDGTQETGTANFSADQFKDFVERTATTFNLDGIKTIATCAFYSASDITGFTNAAVEYVGQTAFYNCYNLQNIGLVAGSQGAYIGQSAFEGCAYLDITDIPARQIGQNAFNNCGSLKNIIIDHDVVCSNNSFKNCTGLKTAIFKGTADLSSPSGTGSAVFNGTTALEKINFVGAAKLGRYSLYNCPALTTVNFAEKPAQKQNYMFSGFSSLTDIYVSWSSGEVDGAPWGATNATVHYDTVFDANGDPIIP